MEKEDTILVPKKKDNDDNGELPDSEVEKDGNYLLPFKEVDKEGDNLL